jgi:ComF family protein
MLEYLLGLQESSPDTIIPVPLHPRRLRERGFNQAHELARPISKGLSIEVCPTGIERFHERPPQITLSRKQRLKNTRGVFRVHNNFPKGHVLIIDDVMTTGATVNELARILKLEGVERVDILTLARAGDNAEFVDTP